MSKGLKRICLNCSMRFYDMDKRPIICPSCSTEFTLEEKVKKRGRPAAEDKPVKQVVAKKPAAEEEDDEIAEIDADDDFVSLEDVDEDDDLDDDDDDAERTLTIDDDPDDLEPIDDDDDEDED